MRKMILCKMTLIVFGIIFIVDIILIRVIKFYNNGIFDDETGIIGDTIGGTTAPIVGILSVILLYFTFTEQRNSNERQRKIADDEQFKTTFFNLLQTQRSILKNLKGNFSYLKNGIDKVEHIEATGVAFFIHANKQLKFIYRVLNHKIYYNNYDSEKAYQKEILIGESIIPDPYLSLSAQENQYRRIASERLPFQLAYINDLYFIEKENYDFYHNLSLGGKVGMGYAFFFNKYEEVGTYFRHLYHILKFIKFIEDKRINDIGKKISKSQESNIHTCWRN